ncbi:hypothetical protein [Natrialba sp. PRR66]|uniref:hypothetical protein n=1 Tax=Natrialba sp. PRR66 TaxID=3098146 RepID=UPI002B1D41D1|nr:hypothetical protein [Natrialba sp. PRR66]
MSTSPDYLANVITDYTSQRWLETVVNYLNLLLPFIPTLIMGGAFWTIGLPTFRLSRNLSTNLLPEQVKIYSDYSGQRTPLMFEIKNEGEVEYTIDVSMKLPEGVVGKDVRTGEEFVNSEFSKTVIVDDNSRQDLQLEFRHDRNRRETANVEFNLSHNTGVLSESVTLYLR